MTEIERVFASAAWGKPQAAVFPPLRQVTTGSKLRSPIGGEAMFFAQNPQVAGMATDDGNVTFNPSFSSTASPVQKQGLFMLESARNHMKTDDAWKGIKLTPEQAVYFQSLNDPYYSQLGDLAKQTLVSRIIGGDKIQGAPYTDEQRSIAEAIARRMTSGR